MSACGPSPQSCARVPTPPKPKETAQTSPPPRADLRRFFVRPAGRDGRKNAWEKLRFRVVIFDNMGYIEMCFDPQSPMNEKLKETLLRMMEGEQ